MEEPKRKLGQIVLRIDDEHGHHIIRNHEKGWSYTIEGYQARPETYALPPQYYMPISQDQVKEEFARQGKEWRFG